MFASPTSVDKCLVAKYLSIKCLQTKCLLAKYLSAKCPLAKKLSNQMCASPMSAKIFVGQINAGQILMLG